MISEKLGNRQSLPRDRHAGYQHQANPGRISQTAGCEKDEKQHSETFVQKVLRCEARHHQGIPGPITQNGNQVRGTGLPGKIP